MQLPEAFENQMRDWLGMNEWTDFRHAFERPPTRGVRLHRIARDRAQLPDVEIDSAHNRWLGLSHPPLPIPPSVAEALGEAVPWSPNSFYIPMDSWLGRSVYHEMGALYIQEPSAMAVVAALNPRPGERILDLCAAPGGKSTAIGAAQRGTGLLVANEIHATRVVTLAQNLERLGIPAIVTNEGPQTLSSRWAQQFDAVLVDAPCSGEGMFRKDHDACNAWSLDSPDFCATRQKEVLQHAFPMVRPGGRLVYSTCTFNPIENEQMALWALRSFPVRVLPLPEWDGWSSGKPEWGDDEPDLTHARRLWPHIGQGEGHFVIAFQVMDVIESNHPSSLTAARSGASGSVRKSKHQLTVRDKTGGSKKQKEGWEAWLASLFGGQTSPPTFHTPVERGDLLYAPLHHNLPLDGIKVLRAGCCIAVRSSTRFEPHHQLAMALAPDAVEGRVHISPAEAREFMAGNPLPAGDGRGWVWVNVDGLPVGWGKSVQGRINNQYPKGLRRADLLTDHF